MALRSSEGAYPTMQKVERPPILVPRCIRARTSRTTRTCGAATTRRPPIAWSPRCARRSSAGERHAFVATDLLWLDGESLLDVPLLERRRLLEGVLDQSYLVRRSRHRAAVGPADARDLGRPGLQGPQLPRRELRATWPARRTPTGPSPALDVPRGVPKPVAPRWAAHPSPTHAPRACNPRGNTTVVG